MMKFLSIFLLMSFVSINTIWETDFDKAKQSAQQEHKLILLYFSGSDWCGPCIRLHKEVMESSEFADYAKDHLVLVNADFPRLKKNQLSKEQQEKNDRLADVYNKDGTFPVTMLLKADGTLIKRWEGFTGLSPAEFIDRIKTVADAGK